MNTVAIFSGYIYIYARKEKEPENFVCIKGNGLSDFSLTSIAYKTLKKIIFECWMVRRKSIPAPSPATTNCAGGRRSCPLHISPEYEALLSYGAALLTFIWKIL